MHSQSKRFMSLLIISSCLRLNRETCNQKVEPKFSKNKNYPCEFCILINHVLDSASCINASTGIQLNRIIERV